MAVTDAWTNPSEGGTLDCDVGDVLTDAKYDGLCSDLLFIGGTAGTRPKTRSVFAPPHSSTGTGVAAFQTSTTGWLAGTRMATGQDNTVYLSLPVPSDFASIVSLNLIFEAGASGNMYYSVTTHYAANGESSIVHTGSIAATTLAMTANVIKTLDIQSSVASLAAGDVLSIQFNRVGSSGSDTIAGVITYAGAKLEYLAT